MIHMVKRFFEAAFPNILISYMLSTMSAKNTITQLRMVRMTVKIKMKSLIIIPIMA